MKIFLDANILIAACGNQKGGSAYLFYIAERDATWQFLTSSYAINEARRNVLQKLPHTYTRLTALITSAQLTVVYPPPAVLVRLAEPIVSTKDAPILAAALSVRAKVLCTLDKKDFHTVRVRSWCRQFHMEIAEPKDLIVAWRNQHRSE